MNTIYAETACLPDGWARNVRVTLGESRILRVEPGATPTPADTRTAILLPAPGNLHSHAFQRAMAGMTEERGPQPDSFWTWRVLMYRFLDILTPEDVEAIAALVYLEMLESGFAAVGEFHYLHHAPGGIPYADPAELSHRIAAAARETGIGLTHLPVHYEFGGAGMTPLAGGQKRFGCDAEAFMALLDAAMPAVRALGADARVGVAPHSLRAVDPGEIVAIAAASPGPVHIHAAEQPKEVADVQAWLGARPVEWLLDNAGVDARWCLIHATHMTAEETAALARSGAVAGLCPITESSLGDGPFNGPDYIASGGAFGVGSDSNVRISLPEELRTLEYAQRLRDLGRNRMVTGPGHTGTSIYLGAAKGAAQALDRDAGQIAEGRLADLVALDRDHPALCALADDQVLDGFVFAAGGDAVTDVWSAGRHVVRNGRHVARDTILARWRATAASLRDRL
ncbi:formimidoylglutamate deiminase [Rhodobacterales bacterium HKCCE2091]|nr:formimidoylglutamate deiminase [Rhodobacterales bacterium HKCCE2091]